MLYAILCYNVEADIGKWTQEQDDAVMERHQQVMGGLAAQGKLGPVARLKPTTTASSVRDKAVFDGPFAETKEQLGGYYLLKARDLNEAIQLAARIPGARLGSVEVRPVMEFNT